MSQTTIALPNFGQTTAELTVVAWLKSEGDHVERGEPLAEVETDKTTVPVESFVAGFLRKVLHPAGSVIAAGEPIAILTSTADEPLEPEPPSTEETRRSAGAPAVAKAASPAGPVRLLATPAAQRLAHEHGVELAALVGSGPGGRILAEDVAAHLAKRGPGPSLALSDSAASSELVELSAVRRTTAARMIRSVREAPQFALSIDVDMTRVERRGVESFALTGRRLSYTAFFLQAVAAVLRQHLGLNVSFEDGRLRCYHDIHLGLAVATPRGLLAPVIRNADQKSLEELDAAAEQLQTKAREGRLPPDTLSSATFTISNLGMYGIDRFTAILNPPQAGILAVGRIAPRPMVVGTSIESRPVVTLTLTADHRAVDGADAARFLTAIRDFLEETKS